MTIDAEIIWRDRAQRLAHQLTTTGALRSPGWLAAFSDVPRHHFVPEFYVQDGPGPWTTVDSSTPQRWLDTVYSNVPLVTKIDAAGHATSSSSQPSAMARMLELLDVRAGHRVLEIGTGTGFNAALLAHHLGGENVASVDVDRELVDAARQRLDAIGYHPVLSASDGVGGLPARAPYNRIIATCAVPKIPWAWARQVSPGGLVLADLKLAANAGNLVLLTRARRNLSGRFVRSKINFMAMRHNDTPDTTARDPHAANPTQRWTTAPAQPWSDAPVAWFLAAFGLPAGVVHGFRLNPDTREPVAARLSSPDGSWAEIDLDAKIDRRRLREAGPTPLWAAVETAHATWTELGQPGWERLGLTVEEHRQEIWLDHPDSRTRWEVPA